MGFTQKPRINGFFCLWINTDIKVFNTYFRVCLVDSDMIKRVAVLLLFIGLVFWGCEEQNNVVSLSNEVDIVWCLVKTQSMNDDFELDDGQWVGSLSSFNPGAGYWFNSSSEMCFNYTCAE